MLICDPSYNPPEMREKLVELAFEKYTSRAIFLAKNAVLSSFATGRQTSLMVDSGYKGTTGMGPFGNAKTQFSACNAGPFEALYSWYWAHCVYHYPHEHFSSVSNLIMICVTNMQWLLYMMAMCY